MNSGLYLVLLLRLYEQRFAELMRLNHNRVTRERVSGALPGPSASLTFVCASVDVYLCSAGGMRHCHRRHQDLWLPGVGTVALWLKSDHQV